MGKSNTEAAADLIPVLAGWEEFDGDNQLLKLQKLKRLYSERQLSRDAREAVEEAWAS